MSTSFPIRSSLAALAVAASLSLPVHAQYVGPNDGQMPASVEVVLQNPVDDQDVRLEGTLLRKIGDEKYIFSDGTGEIVVEIDDDKFPRGQPVSETTRVEIDGEVDTGRNRPPEIEVRQVRVIE